MTERITHNTMQNYTRFPIAVLLWSGWATRERIAGIYRKPMFMYKLTDYGYEQVGWINISQDIRSGDLRGVDRRILETITRLSTFNMLEQAGFDTGPLSSSIILDKEFYDKSEHRPIEDFNKCLFSPFQELPPAVINAVLPFGNINEGEQNTSDSMPQNTDSEELKEKGQTGRTQLVFRGAATSVHDSDADSKLITLLSKEYKAAKRDCKKAAERLFPKFRSANKDRFYPLIASLFQICGFNCEVSRPGVNYQRWDAIIIHAEDSIPIEIKSPGEELHLSVKAIRQALENKIVLLARKQFPTDRESVSLAVGYFLPNDRAEVDSLINDIEEAFQIKIGVIGLQDLLEMAIRSVSEGTQVDHTSLGKAWRIIGLNDA